MERLIPIPTMKDILWDEFMEPLHISIKELSEAIHVPENIITDILDGRSKVDSDLSIRLGKYFGMSENFFINMQVELDRRVAKRDHNKEFAKIKPLKRSYKNISLA